MPLGIGIGLSASLRSSSGIELPGTRYYINPAIGNDSNDGKANVAGRAWATLAKLASAITGGTFVGGGWVGSGGVAAGIGTIGTVAQKDAWYAAYKAGQRVPTGNVAVIDTSLAPATLTALIAMPAGSALVSANGLADIRTNLALSETWTRPNAATYPNVWKTAGTYPLTVPYEVSGAQPCQMFPVGGGNAFPDTTANPACPNLATALPLLNTYPGTFYVDPADNKLCIHTFGGGNPNSDGVQRLYTQNFANGQATPIIDVSGCLAVNISVDGGFLFDPTTSLPVAQYSLSDTAGTLATVIDGCWTKRSGKHGIANVSNNASGFFICRNSIGTLGPGGIGTPNWSLFVDYSPANNGTACSIYEGCSTIAGVANVDGTSGGQDLATGYQSFLTHGGTATFARRKLVNNVFRGATTGINTETLALVTSGNTFGNVISTNSGTWTSTNDVFGTRIPVMDGNIAAVLNNPTLTCNTSYSSTAGNWYGNITINGGTLDLTGANGFTGSMIRNGPITLAINGTTIKALNSPTFGLIYGWLKTDTLAATNLTLVGTNTWGLFGNFESAGMTYSWQYARDAGWIDATSKLNGVAFATANALTSLSPFIAANNTLLTAYVAPIGGTWVPRTSVAYTEGLSNQMTVQNSTGGQDYAVQLLAGSASKTQTLIVKAGTAANLNVRLMANETDANNYWMAVMQAGALNIYEMAAGVLTSRATGTYTAFTDGSIHTLSLVTNGDTITAFVDGVQVASYTAAGRSNKAALNFGFGSFGGNTGCTIDWYTAA